MEKTKYYTPPEAARMEKTKYYTPPEAARILGLSRRRVTQLLNDGRLVGEKADNGRWRVPVAVVDKLCEERSRQSLSRRAPAHSTLEEHMERAALLERRLERLTDSLSRLFTRLESLENKIHELNNKQNH